MRKTTFPATLAALLFLAGAAHAAGPDYAAIVAAPDRSDADRQTDARRKPVELLAFTGARPGMKVLDVGAGAGYSTELMARAVAPGGTVYAQDSAATIEQNVKDKFDLRAAKPAMANVVRVVRPYDEPVAPGTGKLDLVTFFFWYHDTTYMAVDRAKMDKALFAALKPGGFLVVADHSAKPGTGVSAGHPLHRIDEDTLKREVEASGFKLVAEGNFLRNPDDPRDTSVFRSPVPVDNFVLKFQKPAEAR